MNTLIEKYLPKKYHHCVEDFYKDIDGYWLELKNDFISTTTQTHTIHEMTLSDLRKEFKTIVYNVDCAEVHIKNCITIFDLDEYYLDKDNEFNTPLKIDNEDSKEIIGFARDEAEFIDISERAEVGYKIDENNKIIFESISEAIEFLIERGYEVNKAKGKEFMYE
ncbi:hypothetical protein HMPREF2664_09535 [Staphylococcus sp. HMSC064E03]|uniref:hypothetical protein n=1 Tax=unclassified Staphylococcus TaxID=91994 RepID=UPI0008A626B4|nr:MULTISPECIES: hypothetical protein [unclassified Staphylococcus]OFS54357.1 hypothetical protein HMPREF2862_09355 [Staphylococcus sp. HMSC065C09]OHQ11081.1 hypothetical protein HMPREF2664_09535 [Staphylococcus sp. HMSC064E03]